jgi:hypothetical protein
VLLGHHGNVGNVEAAAFGRDQPSGTATETGWMYERLRAQRRVPARALVVAPTHPTAAPTTPSLRHPRRPPDRPARRPLRAARVPRRPPADWGGNDGNPFRISIESQCLGQLKRSEPRPAAGLDARRGQQHYPRADRLRLAPHPQLEDEPILIDGVDLSANNLAAFNARSTTA